MNIFLSIKYHADQSNRAHIEKILAALECDGNSATCIVRDVEAWGAHTFDARELMRRTFEAIDASDVVVVDLAEKGVGVGIEAGYAFAKKIPIVVIAPRGADVSETLRGIAQRVIEYDVLVGQVSNLPIANWKFAPHFQEELNL
ncbi:MAG: nucleoside 2-deoxyribosyltransferase [Chloroflexi bacterium]|nr:nucleoside 2-deoxyribosyltransferase [Chloroflexota bacterium]